MIEKLKVHFRRSAKTLVVLTAGILLLSSCIDVNEDITISADGSGVVKLAYRIARVVIDLPRAENTSVAFPLPTNPAEFESLVQNAPGLTLQDFTLTNEAATLGANATIQFTGVEALNAAFTNSVSQGFTYLSTPSRTTFTQRIYQGNSAGVDQQTLDLVKSLFGDYKLVFSLHAPRAIQSVNIGSTSSNETTATYSTTIPDIIQSKTPVIWEVSW